MGKYNHDMSGEKDPNRVFEIGWYDWEIVKVEQQTSKQGNEMFKVSLALAADPQSGLDIYAVAEQGKRWFLKQLLKACDCPVDEAGNFDWSEEDVEGKTVQGRIENNQETWIDRDGKERTNTKSKIVEFRRLVIK